MPVTSTSLFPNPPSSPSSLPILQFPAAFCGMLGLGNVHWPRALVPASGLPPQFNCGVLPSPPTCLTITRRT